VPTSFPKLHNKTAKNIKTKLLQFLFVVKATALKAVVQRDAMRHEQLIV